MKDKLIIRPSNLSFRFYKHDGWTKELVKSFLITGAAEDPFPEDEYPYYRIERSSTLDKKKVLDECFIEHCWFWSKQEHDRTQEQIFDSYK